MDFTSRAGAGALAADADELCRGAAEGDEAAMTFAAMDGAEFADWGEMPVMCSAASKAILVAGASWISMGPDAVAAG